MFPQLPGLALAVDIAKLPVGLDKQERNECFAENRDLPCNSDLAPSVIITQLIPRGDTKIKVILVAAFASVIDTIRARQPTPSINRVRNPGLT
jgi:hypothetical protein